MVYVTGILIFAFAFFAISRLLEGILRRGYVTKLISESSSSSALPARLSLAVLPKSRIFRSVSLPIPGKEGEEIQLGTVIVSRSGIFILCQLNGNGILDNSHSGKWKHISNGKFTEFDNPFASQSDARTLIEYYTEALGFPEIKAHSIVLYTGTALRFTAPKPRGVIHAKDFAGRLTLLEKQGKLTVRQIKAACSVLKEAELY